VVYLKVEKPWLRLENICRKYYYVKDSLNNILGIFDDNGALVVKYELDAY
jgi:hypothetical protein